jgi:hypothetical protein
MHAYLVYSGRHAQEHDDLGTSSLVANTNATIGDRSIHHQLYILYIDRFKMQSNRWH